MREAADVILMGAATVRIENYSGAQFSIAQRQARQRRGQAEVPPIAVITVADHDAKFLFHPQRGGPADPDVHQHGRRRAAPAGHRRRGDRRSGPTRAGSSPRLRCESWLNARCFGFSPEGGPQLLSTLIEDNLLDELCLTVAPMLIGGVARRIATDPARCTPRCGRRICHRPRGLSVHTLRSRASRDAVATVVCMRRQPVRALRAWTVVPDVTGTRHRVRTHLRRRPQVRHRPGARPQGQPETMSAAPAGPPPIEAPKNDLSWSDCTARLFGEAFGDTSAGHHPTARPTTPTSNPIDGANGTLNIGVRARSPQTPSPTPVRS